MSDQMAASRTQSEPEAPEGTEIMGQAVDSLGDQDQDQACDRDRDQAHDRDRDQNQDNQDDDSRSVFSIQLDWSAQMREKAFLGFAVIFPLLVSTILLVFAIENRSARGRIYTFVENDRAVLQGIINLIAGILGGLNVFTVIKLINHTTFRLLSKGLSVDAISYARAICSRSVNLRLRGPLLATSMLAALAYAIPPFIWTIALTPKLITVQSGQDASLPIPQFSQSSMSIWANNSRITGDCQNISTALGTFSDCPIPIIHGILLSEASQAEPNLTGVHIKPDNTPYLYIGRSYGIGSAVGLSDQHFAPSLAQLENSTDTSYNVVNYNFMELGYRTEVNCFLNESTDFHLVEIQGENIASGVPNIYFATGVFPNSLSGQPDIFASVGVGNDSDVVVVAAKRSAGRNVILVTAGANYGVLNRTQCEVILQPTKFNVMVDVEATSIYVEPINSTAGDFASSFDPTEGIESTLVEQFNAFGFTSTSLYTSVIGNALTANLVFNNITSSDISGVHNAMSDSFAAIFDTILLFVASSQLFIPAGDSGDHKNVDTVLMVPAVDFGARTSIYVLFGLCLLLLFAVIIQALRAMMWKGLPRWDFMDNKDLVFAHEYANRDFSTKTRRKTTEGDEKSQLDRKRSHGQPTIRLKLEGTGEDVAPVRPWLSRDRHSSTAVKRAVRLTITKSHGQGTRKASLALNTNDAMSDFTNSPSF